MCTQPLQASTPQSAIFLWIQECPLVLLALPPYVNNIVLGLHLFTEHWFISSNALLARAITLGLFENALTSRLYILFLHWIVWVLFKRTSHQIIILSKHTSNNIGNRLLEYARIIVNRQVHTMDLYLSWMAGTSILRVSHTCCIRERLPSCNHNTA